MLGVIIPSNVYSYKAPFTFESFVVISSDKVYGDDKVYIDRLKTLDVRTIEDIYLYKNIKVDFIYDVFYKKMNGEGFLINISSDKTADLSNSDIEDLVLVLEELLNIKFEDSDKSILFSASKENAPKFKIVIDKYDLWFNFYPKTSSSNGYFESFVAISKNKPA